METVQQNGRFTLFSSKFHSSIYSIFFGIKSNKNCSTIKGNLYQTNCGLPLLFLQNLRRDQTFKNVFFVSNYRRTHKTIENEDDIQAILF